jgi:hypothetical protein
MSGEPAKSVNVQPVALATIARERERIGVVRRKRSGRPPNPLPGSKPASPGQWPLMTVI